MLIMLTRQKGNTLKSFKIQNFCSKFIQAFCFWHVVSVCLSVSPSLPLQGKDTLPLPGHSRLDKLSKPCSYLAGYPHVTPSAREWRWPKNFGSKGDMTNILIFTVPCTTCSSVNELICFVKRR